MCVCVCESECTCFFYFVGPGDKEHTNGVGPNSLVGPKIVGPTQKPVLMCLMLFFQFPHKVAKFGFVCVCVCVFAL